MTSPESQGQEPDFVGYIPDPVDAPPRGRPALVRPFVVWDSDTVAGIRPVEIDDFGADGFEADNSDVSEFDEGRPDAPVQGADDSAQGMDDSAQGLDDSARGADGPSRGTDESGWGSDERGWASDDSGWGSDESGWGSDAQGAPETVDPQDAAVPEVSGPPEADRPEGEATTAETRAVGTTDTDMLDAVATQPLPPYPGPGTRRFTPRIPGSRPPGAPRRSGSGGRRGRSGLIAGIAAFTLLAVLGVVVVALLTRPDSGRRAATDPAFPLPAGSAATGGAGSAGLSRASASPSPSRSGRVSATATATPSGSASAVTGAANTTGANLARDKPASASSVLGSLFSAGNAVDGSVLTTWVSDSGDPQWISVDLGTVWQVSRVVLRWGYPYAAGYQIRVSLDGKSWTTVYSTDSGDGGTDEVSFAAVPARQVMMYGTRRNGLTGYTLSEFEVH